MTTEEPKKINWEVPEFETPKRSKNWYITVITLSFVLIFFSFFSLSLFPFSFRFKQTDNNFLFAIIIVLSFWVMYLNEKRGARIIKVEINGEGLILDNKAYDYDDLKDFCVLYKPNKDIKHLYFNFKNGAKFRLSIPLKDLDPLMVRNFLKKYLDEDLERTDPPVSEQLSRFFKLSQ